MQHSATITSYFLSCSYTFHVSNFSLTSGHQSAGLWENNQIDMNCFSFPTDVSPYAFTEEKNYWMQQLVRKKENDLTFLHIIEALIGMRWYFMV